ncbi:hypothetical protein A8B98_22770 [Hymenobacter sp. UV11]|nr:hypothetical protein A8B98_22770 [Hymenobacter sp. UV11]
MEGRQSKIERPPAERSTENIGRGGKKYEEDRREKQWSGEKKIVVQRRKVESGVEEWGEEL